MTQPQGDNSNTLVVDGDAAIIMRALRNHSTLKLDQLRSLVSQQLETEDSFEPVINYLRKNEWIEDAGTGERLTEIGEEWLDKQGAEMAVEDEDSGSSEPKEPYDVAKLKMETRHLSVFQALRKIERDEIKLNPDFQRAFVWDEVKQSRLIESILIRIPLPAFYLDATDQISWNVVDGLQRLTTLNRYCRRQEFSLTGLQFLKGLEGKKFAELPPPYRILIEDDTQLLFYNLMPGTPIEAKFTIFSRVNTGGMQLTPQEIRHALNQGKITALLAKMARSNAFRVATEGVVENLRMSDRELILRAMAFMHLGVDEYKHKNELDAFLLNAMSQFNKLPDDQLEKLEREFYESIGKVRSVFGRYSFRKFYEHNGRRSPLNKALFEVWVVCIRSYDKEILLSKKEQIIEEFMKLINPYEPHSDPFIRSISASTGGFSAVKTRFTEIESLLKRALQ